MSNLPPPISDSGGEAQFSFPPPTLDSQNEPQPKNFKKAKRELRTERAKTRALRPWFRKKRLIIPLVLLGFPTALSLFGANSGVSNESKENTPRTTVAVTVYSYTTLPQIDWVEILKSGVVADELSQSLCQGLDSLMSKQSRIIGDRLKATDKPSEDAFESADYLKSIDWSGFKHKENIMAEQLALSDPVLVSASSITPTTNQSKDFLKDTLIFCTVDQESLSVFSARLLAEATSLDNRLVWMQSQAQNLPWYPKGYLAYYDPDIAWRWLDRNEFRCAYGNQCWGISIIAREGCPTSLYAEITILDGGGANIGYTNDLTSGLLKGQEGRLVFEDFTPGADSARLSEISCY